MATIAADPPAMIAPQEVEKAAVLSRNELGQFTHTPADKLVDAWYWNDAVNPYNAEWTGRSGFGDLLNMHVALDIDPDDQRLRLMLADIHADMGDDDGAEFWQWMAAHDRRPDYLNTFWWFDNNLLEWNESRFCLPNPMFRRWIADDIRLPKVRTLPNGASNEGHPLREIYPDPEWRQEIGAGCNINMGEKITEIGFDGRLCAETTALATWRLLGPITRTKIKWGDYKYEPEDGKPETR